MNARVTLWLSVEGPGLEEKTVRCPPVSWEVKKGIGMRSPGGRGGRETKAQGCQGAGKWSPAAPG